MPNIDFSIFFRQHLCWGSVFLPSLSVSWSDCWKRAFRTPWRHQDIIIVVIVVVVVPPVFIYQKVIYNIGTEILMLQCNLHNSTQEAPTELSLSEKKILKSRPSRWNRPQRFSDNLRKKQTCVFFHAVCVCSMMFSFVYAIKIIYLHQKDVLEPFKSMKWSSWWGF